MPIVTSGQVKLRGLIASLSRAVGEVVAAGDAPHAACRHDDAGTQPTPSYLTGIYHGLRAGRQTAELQKLSREELRDFVTSELVGFIRHLTSETSRRLDDGRADFLSEYNREHLLHGLGHVGCGHEDLHAVPPLLLGLEGALRNTVDAESQGAVPNPLAGVEDTHDRPPKRFDAAERVVKALGPDKS